MIVFAFLVMMLVVAGLVFALVSVINFLTRSPNPGNRSRGKRQSINFILAPIRQRFGAENMRAGRLGELNFFRPALIFDYGRTMVRLKHFGSPWRSGRKQTVLETHFALPGNNQLLVVSTGQGVSQPQPMERYKSGDDEFDRDFHVYSNAPALTKTLLTDPIKWKMAELKNLQSGEIRFHLANGLLVTSCNQWFGSGQELLDFTQGGLELFDQLMLHNEDGVDFLNEGQAAVIENFCCPICSDEVMQDMVVCKRCKTPHCAECWEYNGKCAMFACGEERCIRVEEHEV